MLVTYIMKNNLFFKYEYKLLIEVTHGKANLSISQYNLTKNMKLFWWKLECILFHQEGSYLVTSTP